ncbi:MAG TPA: hypothetical protein VF173_03930 [Thermoanaerobaculia bacterium]|nr:hypothetical protein [Thermoanaerobaculia bacterium]
MARHVGLRICVLLLLLIPLASPAGAVDKPAAKPRDGGFTAFIWHAVAEIRKAFLPDATGKGDSRGGMDPDGLTVSPPGGDSRGTMDPDGRN